MEIQKATLQTLRDKVARGEKLVRLSANDYPTALLIDRAGFDMILVGDSLGMTALGYTSTIPVTMDEMLHHCKAVMRAVRHCFVIGDMPFMSYQVSIEEAVRNAGRLVKEGGVDAVKVEGGKEVAPVIRAIVNAGMVVSGHIGLTPQYAAQLGGFKVQGKSAEVARRLIEDARAIQAAGASIITLEAIPAPLAKIITEQLGIITMGIGAGPHTHGQSLVLHDVIGMFDRFRPKFVKQYANVGASITDAICAFKKEVEQGIFPAAENSYTMPEEELALLLKT
jgi:3-methyl-2-oxobutanoate hydroxymethyltransferase